METCPGEAQGLLRAEVGLVLVSSPLEAPEQTGSQGASSGLREVGRRSCPARISGSFSSRARGCKCGKC